MSTGEVRLERRAGQRFGFQMPVVICRTATGREGSGFTQDLSARGASFYTDLTLVQGDAVELTLVMPSEITLAESMRVRCRGKVVRVFPSVVPGKFGVAVQLHGYEFLPDANFPSAVSESTARAQAQSLEHA
jgi:PilZ domain